MNFSIAFLKSLYYIISLFQLHKPDILFLIRLVQTQTIKY